jgi:multidrug transporter EmrE-like cation transporter
MNLLVKVLPVALLVTYGQLMVKWRMQQNAAFPQDAKVFEKLVVYLGDPLILSAYLAALIGSFAWLFVVSRLPLALAFPIYQGMTFAFVIVGSRLTLGEQLTPIKLVSVILILAGLALGSRE